MAAERSTRDRLLDSFETLLVEGGSRAATLDAVAAHAGTSKGGLLYHFHTKDDLTEAMLDRLIEQANEDTKRMRVASEGPVAYYLNTSVDSGSAFDRALIATARIAYERSEPASEALGTVRAQWLSVLEAHLNDHALAQTVQLIGDGLYFNDTTGHQDPGALPAAHKILRRLGI